MCDNSVNPTLRLFSCTAVAKVQQWALMQKTEMDGAFSSTLPHVIGELWDETDQTEQYVGAIKSIWSKVYEISTKKTTQTFKYEECLSEMV